MTGESQSRLVGRLEAISAAAAAGVFAVGCLVLLGWVFDIAALKSVDPSLVSTKADTATAFVLTGIALWLSQAGRRGFRAGRYVVWSSAALVAAIGLLTLLEYASGRSFGIDQLFFTEPAGAVRTIHPGRMAPNTAVNFLFIGLALLLLDVRTRRGHRPAQFLIGLGGMVAAVALVGYLYDVSSFYSPSSATTPMSVLAALAGMIAFLGLALARPAPALVALLTGENAGSVMARRLLLPVLLAPVLLDLLLLAGQWTGLYGEHVASAVHTILLTVGLFGLVWMTAVSLNRSDSRRRQAEEAQALLASYPRLNPNPVLDVDLAGQVRFANPAAARLFPELEQTGPGHPFLAGWQPTARALRDNGVPSSVREVMVGPRCYQQAMHYVAETESIRIFGLDVTERRRIEEQIQQVNRELEQRVSERTEELRGASLYARSLLEASLDPLVTISPEGKITDVNQATEQATGAARDALIGADFSDYFTEPAKAREGYQRVLSEGLVRDYPLTIRQASGKTTDVLYNAVVYRNELGQVQGVFAAARDVTERKRLEEERRAASLYARGLLEASVDPLVTISPEGKITDVNQATEEATGVSRRELIGSDFSRYFTEPDRADEGYHRVLAEGLVRDYPLTIRHAAGQTIDVLYNATVYKNHAGELQGVFAAARDVTQRKRAEEELRHYREHLEELVAQRTTELARSNQDLEQFAYVASHDLQEPLRMVTGYLQLLRERYHGHIDEKADKYIAYTVDGAERMSMLIRDLLAYSRTGRAGDAQQEADAGKALDAALRNLASAIKQSGAVVVHDALPVVRADRTQLVQLFQNLVGNALKFRSPGRAAEIRVAARREAEEWLFSVRDNGLGFEQQYAEKIFVIFQRLHARGQYPGTGIGLAICKRIVQRHGGRIWASGEPGQGATFFFTVPL